MTTRSDYSRRITWLGRSCVHHWTARRRSRVRVLPAYDTDDTIMVRLCLPASFRGKHGGERECGGSRYRRKPPNLSGCNKLLLFHVLNSKDY
jgi:hypothetical protein